MRKKASRRGPENRPEARQQLTVRGVPDHVARALRAAAARSKKSLNRTLVEALARQAGCEEGGEQLFGDLDELAGKWVEDRAFDEAVAAHDTVDEDLWK